MPNRANYAAVDLGSNSFHLLIARLEHNELRVLDRVKEMVRLAEGVDKHGMLHPEVRDRALECLQRFSQLLRRVPLENTRAVATQSFRRLRHPGQFIHAVEQALGCEVEIIGGREEARLVYQGVYAHRPPSDDNMLVIDIGGGSTELVIGCGVKIRHAESLQYGCVVVTRDFFSDGKLSKKRWQHAITSARSDLHETALTYARTGYRHAVGASGTIRAVASICQAQGWCEQHITQDALHKLTQHMHQAGHIGALQLPGLSERRRPVIAGGVAILSALFAALNIEAMQVSSTALREGLLDDMLDKMRNDDPRQTTIQAFAQRYRIDAVQAARVMRTCQHIHAATKTQWRLSASQLLLLELSATIHEAGLAIAHSQYQRHTGYLVAASDMPGFSQLEQRFMATLTRHHRRNIPSEWHDGLPPRLHQTAAYCVGILRLAFILHRDRTDSYQHPLISVADEQCLQITLDQTWVQDHPLTLYDLDNEQAQWSQLGLRLQLNQPSA